MGMLGTFWNWMKGKKDTGDGPDLGPVLNQYKFKNPDHLWRMPGTITFFYVPTTKKLFTDRGDITHAQMIKNPKVGQEILPDLWDQNHPSPRIEAVKRGIFAGRLIPNKLVSLWNNNKAELDQHIPELVAALRAKGYANDQTAISTPAYYPFFAGKETPVSGDTKQEVDPRLQFDPRILHVGAGLGKLKMEPGAQHVLKPQEKWIQAMNLPPGQRLWKPTSENQDLPS